MESLHLPSQLTEEEEILQQKYVKLKKKKKALTISRAPKLEKQESSSDSLKRPVDEDAAVATEQAKKLLQSGVIKLSSEKKEQSTFKRSKRLKDNDNKSAVNFHPFSHGDGTDGNNRLEITGTRPKPKFNLYDNFVSATSTKAEETRESLGNQKGEASVLSQAKRGHTIYVNGAGLSEEILKKACASFGTIVNISSEFEKNCGFVTFEKSESADEAIERLNGSMVSNVHLKVSLARRQPNIDAPSSDQSKSSWSSIAASSSQKGSHRDSRDLIIYGEEDDIF